MNEQKISNTLIKKRGEIMLRIIMTGVIFVLVFLFSIVEAKADHVIFPYIVVITQRWLPAILGITLSLLYGIKRKCFKTAKSDIILAIISVMILVIRIRDEFTNITSQETDFLIFSNRILLISIIFYTLIQIIKYFKAWPYIQSRLSAIFGDYRAPKWTSYLKKYAFGNKKQVLIGCMVYLALFGLGKVLVSLEPSTKTLKDASQASSAVKAKDKSIKFYISQVGVPQITKVKDGVKVTPQQLNISFDENPFKLGSKFSLSGTFQIIPEVEGEWEKKSDRLYSFIPKKHWDLAEDYHLVIDDRNLRKNILLSSLKEKIPLVAPKIWFDSQKFYVNPKNSNEKKVVITLSSNIPLDLESVRKHSEFTLLDNKNKIIKKLKLEIFHDEALKNFYLHSGEVELGHKVQNVSFKYSKGVESKYSSKTLKLEDSVNILIPSKYSFLQIDIGQIETKYDAMDKPYYGIDISSNTRIGENELRSKLSIFELKSTYSKEEYQDIVSKYGKAIEKCFNSDYKKKNLILSSCSLLKTKEISDFKELVSKKMDYSIKDQKLIDEMKYELVIDAKPDIYYHIALKKGFTSIEGHELEYDKVSMVETDAFPKELKFATEGSILSLNEKKKISIFSRGTKKAIVKLHQIKANQLQHFLAFSSGDKKNPYFYYKHVINKENISDTYVEEISFNSNDYRGVYGEFDFSNYLNKRSHGNLNYGIYFVSLIDPVTEKVKANQLFILSDMVYLLKISNDNISTIFVGSQSLERPLNNVEILEVEKNGNTKNIGWTNQKGEFSFSQGFYLKGTVGYILKKGDDRIFLSTRNRDHIVDYSRFEVAGEFASQDKLKVSFFSDRKLYRPGESGHMAFIFKDKDWSRLYEDELIHIQITDSRGKAFLAKDQKIQEYGFNTLDFLLPYSAPTGDYSVEVFQYYTVDNLRGKKTYKRSISHHNIKVQEFLPDKLKMTTNFSKGHKKLWVKANELKAMVSLRNLFGTPAVKNEVRSRITLNPRDVTSRKYSSYRFYNEGLLKYSVSKELQSKYTDEKGKAEIEINLDEYINKTFNLEFFAEGMMKSGGRSVFSNKNIMVSDLDFLVGYKAKGNLNYISTKKTVSVELIALGQDENLLEKEVQIEIFEKKYKNALVKQADQTYEYQDIKEPILLKKSTFKIRKTNTLLKLDNSKVGDFIVKIRDQKERTLNSFDYSIVGEGDLARSLHRSNELKVSLNKKDYKVGEEVKISLKAPYKGMGLITIEKDKVYASKWFRLSNETSELGIKIPKELEGNGYINISLLRSTDSEKIFTSPFSYAVVPFTLDRSQKTENIELKYQSLVKPGEKINISYKSKNKGKIILYAVDEGILQLAHYKAPTPLLDFYKKAALRVDTYQIFSLILPDINAVKNAFAAGGGKGAMALSRNLNPFQRKFTKAVAFWSGILNSDNKWQNYEMRVPYGFNGTLKVFAVYVNPKKVGTKRGKIISRDDIIISPTLPTFIAPDDEFIVSASIANNIEGNIVEDEIDVVLTGDFTGGKKQSQKVKIKKGQDEVVTFKLKAPKDIGAKTIKIIASSGNVSSEFRDGISVRPLLPRINRIWQALLKKGEYVIRLDDMEYFKEFFNLKVDVYPGLLGLIKGRMEYLGEYPFGCSEQLTSKALPYAVLSPDLLGKTKEDQNKYLEATNSLLLQRQMSSGEIALYEGDHYSFEYLNLYIAHFLTLSKEKGVFYNKVLFDRLFTYIKSLAKNGSLFARSYSMFLMAKNEMQVGAFAKLLQEEKKTDIYTQLYLAATYKILKWDDKANELIQKIEKNRKKATFQDPYWYNSASFNSAYLGVLVNYFSNDKQNIISELAESLLAFNNKNGMSSHQAGQLLLVLGDLKNSLVSDLKIYVQTSTKELKLSSTEFDKLDLKTKMSIEKLSLDIDKDLWSFLNVNLSAFPKVSKSYNNGLQISKKLLDLEGNEIQSVKNGSEALVEIKVQADRNIEDAVIIDLLPGGFDIVFDYNGDSSMDVSFADKREDRIIIYTKIKTQTDTFRYKIKAVSPGRFSLPPVYVENMYKTVESALSEIDEVKITE